MPSIPGMSERAETLGSSPMLPGFYDEAQTKRTLKIILFEFNKKATRKATNLIALPVLALHTSDNLRNLFNLTSQQIASAW